MWYLPHIILEMLFTSRLIAICSTSFSFFAVLSWSACLVKHRLRDGTEGGVHSTPSG
jgi:hypothetical protein